MQISNELLVKYNVPGPRYTSYPPATKFSDAYSGVDLKKDLVLSNEHGPKSISLYLHIPFCLQLCHFCGCNTTVCNDQERMYKYVQALKKEMTIYAEMLDNDREVTQIHWGGGTPNVLPMEYIKEVMDVIHSNFLLDSHAEVAMECNPAYLSIEDIDKLNKTGINRLSLGIQDFDPKILQMVNRAIPEMDIKLLVDKAKSVGMKGVNLDFIYGLPGQTVDSFLDSIERAIAINPDRIVTFSYAHVPWMKKYQRVLEKYTFPDVNQKMAMRNKSQELLVKNGYETIGLDHYAKPEDELSQALILKRLHRNFQGYCTKETTGQVYAFGTSAISQLWNSYSQNTKDIDKYIDDIAIGKLPVEKGYRLSQQDRVCRDIINEIMCNGQLNYQKIADQHNIHIEAIQAISKYSEDRLSELANDGLIVINEKGFEVTETGKLFSRNIAMLFDPELIISEQKFSKTV